jgi:hypothetical protein
LVASEAHPAFAPCGRAPSRRAARQRSTGVHTGLWCTHRLSLPPYLLRGACLLCSGASPHFIRRCGGPQHGAGRAPQGHHGEPDVLPGNALPIRGQQGAGEGPGAPCTKGVWLRQPDRVTTRAPTATTPYMKGLNFTDHSGANSAAGRACRVRPSPARCDPSTPLPLRLWCGLHQRHLECMPLPRPSCTSPAPAACADVHRPQACAAGAHQGGAAGPLFAGL